MSNHPTALECSICQLPFADTGGQSPRLEARQHQCPFCHKSFNRVDGARRHAKTCPKKGDQPLPPLARRGRKLRACNQCSRVKVQCDGKKPCLRCSSKSIDCTYSWICNDSSHREAAAKLAEPNKPAVSGGLHLELPFLIRNLDSTTEFENERDAAQQPESNVGGPTTRKSSPTITEEQVDCLDPALLLSNYMDPLLDTYLSLDDAYGDLNSEGPESYPLLSSGNTLRNRLELLSQELEIYSLRKPKLGNTFQRQSFHDLFTSDNVRGFAVAFSRKRHYQLPVIHWPTFDIVKAPLPLLLAVAMTGASYSHLPGAQPDPALQARTFHRISGAYIFSSLKTQMDLECGLDSLIEMCQAALLILGLGAWVKDEEARRILLTKHRPKLTQVIRDHQFAQVRHEKYETWSSFIRKESQIRIASWAFYMDCLATLSTNHPPSFSLSEMCGHSPCSAEFWDAETEDDFQKRQVGASTDFHCLDDQMTEIMGDDWAQPQNLVSNRLSLYHLHAMSCALLPIIFNFHTSKLPESHSAPLFRALDRWEHLWATISRQTPEDQRKWLGVSRNSPGLIWISRRILEARPTSEAKNWRYFQRIPSYKTADVFEFVRHLRVDSEH